MTHSFVTAGIFRFKATLMKHAGFRFLGIYFYQFKKIFFLCLDIMHHEMWMKGIFWKDGMSTK